MRPGAVADSAGAVGDEVQRPIGGDDGREIIRVAIYRALNVSRAAPLAIRLAIAEPEIEVAMSRGVAGSERPIGAEVETLAVGTETWLAIVMDAGDRHQFWLRPLTLCEPRHHDVVAREVVMLREVEFAAVGRERSKRLARIGSRDDVRREEARHAHRARSLCARGRGEGAEKADDVKARQASMTVGVRMVLVYESRVPGATGESRSLASLGMTLSLASAGDDIIARCDASRWLLV